MLNLYQKGYCDTFRLSPYPRGNVFAFSFLSKTVIVFSIFPFCLKVFSLNVHISRSLCTL